MPQIYITPKIATLQEFLGDWRNALEEGAVIQDHLGRLADRVLYGLNCGGEYFDFLYPLFNNYHPAFLGWTSEQLAQQSFSLPDCQLLVARERGYQNWKEVLALGDLRFDPDFEKALERLLAGDLKTLGRFLSENPDLIRKKSPYPHGATLLHYCGSNGVEMWRQQVPENLADLISLLLDSGADPQAKMQVYGGQFTTAELLDTSAHPRDAGNWAAAKAALART